MPQPLPSPVALARACTHARPRRDHAHRRGYAAACSTLRPRWSCRTDRQTRISVCLSVCSVFLPVRLHTYHLHPLECITTICNSSPTLHPRGVNNTSPALGGVSAECICKLELQPSLYNCSGASCNCRQYSAIAAEHCSAAIADCRQIRSFGVFAMERQHCSSRKCQSAGAAIAREEIGRKRPFPSPPRGKLAVWASELHGAFVSCTCSRARRGFCALWLVDFDQPVQRRVVARHLACASDPGGLDHQVVARHP